MASSSTPRCWRSGSTIGIVGAVGWYRDAGREWQRTEIGRELVGRQRDPGPGRGQADASRRPPARSVTAGRSSLRSRSSSSSAGSSSGRWLIAGGLVMGVIAALGWYLDAGREYRQVDAGHPAEPRTRDPERAFPKQSVPVYLGVAGVTVFITLLPWLLTFLPSAASGVPGGSPGAATTTATISASSAASFDTQQVVVVAGQPITLTFDNKNAGVPHNVAIYDSSARAKDPLHRRDHHRTGDRDVQRARAAPGHLLLPVRRPPEHERRVDREVRTRRPGTDGSPAPARSRSPLSSSQPSASRHSPQRCRSGRRRPGRA